MEKSAAAAEAAEVAAPVEEPAIFKVKLKLPEGADPGHAALLDGSINGWNTGKQQSQGRVTFHFDEPHPIHLRFISVRNDGAAFIRIWASLRGGQPAILVPWRQLCSRQQLLNGSKRLLKPVSFNKFSPFTSGPTARWDTIIIDVAALDSFYNQNSQGTAGLKWINVVGEMFDDAAQSRATEKKRRESLQLREASKLLGLMTTDEYQSHQDLIRKKSDAQYASILKMQRQHSTAEFAKLVERTKYEIQQKRQSRIDAKRHRVN